jgi:uncharacterized protein (TIGR02996 family)
MSVYFVYRTTYNSPLEKHVRRFDDDSVLAWARRVWRPIADGATAFQYAEALLGGLDVHSFGSVFTGLAEDGGAPPDSMAAVRRGFEHMYTNEVSHGPHHLQLMTDDDETEMAVYLFDDHYRAAHPGRADFLLHDGWELPAGGAKPRKKPLPDTHPEGAGDGEGALYAVCLAAFDSGNLSDLGSTLPRIEGVRVEGLCRYLLLSGRRSLSGDLEIMRAALRKLFTRPKGEDAGFLKAIRETPAEAANWNAYSDWLLERDRPAAGLHLLERALGRAEPSKCRKNRDPARDLVRVTPHMAQAAKHEGSWPEESFMWFTPHDTFETWVVFDDCWAAAHKSLAEGLVRFSTRWDVL